MKFSCLTLAAAVTMLHASAASAQVFSEGKIQLGAGLSYGLYVGEAADQIPSPYGLGLGARAGYTLTLPFYFGLEGNYFFGASQRFPQYGDVEGSLQIVHYGAEVGYDLGLTRSLVLRPKLGVGRAKVTATLTVEGITDDVSETGPVLTGGLALLYGTGMLFFMLEARYTSLNIETKKLENVPGINVEDGARLDGLLFSACVGVAF